MESDGKHLVAKTSPVSQQPSPPIVPPKPFGKTITEYRTIRRIDNDGETGTTTTVRNGTIPSNNKRLIPIESDDRLSTSSSTSHEDLMESIRRFGGSHNLGKK